MRVGLNMPRTELKRVRWDKMSKNTETNDIVKIKVRPFKCLYNSPNFKIYSCYPNVFNNDGYSDTDEIKLNSYGNVTIKGDFQELDFDCDYTVTGYVVEDKKYGAGYVVQNIRRDAPLSYASSKAFLEEILTANQADTLLTAYPDIINKIMNDDLSDIDLNKTNGIKEHTFESIKKKVIENYKLSELVEEYGNVFSISVIKKLYENYASIDKIRESLKENPYTCLCQLGGIGFKTADALLLKLESDCKEKILNNEKPVIEFNDDLISSYQRMKAAMMFILEQNENEGHTYMVGSEFRKMCIKFAPEAMGHFLEILSNESDIFFNKETKRIARQFTYNTEKYIADRIKEGLNTQNKWNIDCGKYNVVDGIVLSEEQQKTCKTVCDSTITMLVGFAGAGKTYSSKALINLITDNRKDALLLAPTGRASKVLEGYTNHPASTIHRGLGFKPPREWGYNEYTKLNCDIVIVDEFSMVDIYLFKHLLEAIDFNKTKLLLIGDDAQIPSVSCGNLLHDFIESEIIPTVRLTKIFRYGKGGINTVATDIRLGKSSFDKDIEDLQIIGDDKGFVYRPISQIYAIDKIVNLYKQLLEKGIDKEDILILTAQNVGDYGTQKLNNRIQSEVNPETEKILKYGDIEYKVGDLIIQCVNNYDAYKRSNIGLFYKEITTFISNGEIGKIIDIGYNFGEQGIVVDFNNNNIIFIPKSQMTSIKLGYAISIHKSQGGQARYIIVFAPKAHSYMLNSNLLYVGVTRAKEKCILIGELEIYNRSIKKKENLERNTFMCRLLKSTQ